MVTIQLPLDPETSAQLAFLAELWEQRKVEIALDLLKDSVSQKFKEHYDRKGRSLLSVNVEVKDSGGNVVSAGSFSWYIQKI